MNLGGGHLVLLDCWRNGREDNLFRIVKTGPFCNGVWGELRLHERPTSLKEPLEEMKDYME
jgi:hypothetical protein